MTVYKIHVVVEFLEGWGWGYFSGQKMEILGKRGGLREIASMGAGMDIFWNYTMNLVLSFF